MLDVSCHNRGGSGHPPTPQTHELHVYLPISTARVFDFEYYLLDPPPISRSVCEAHGCDTGMNFWGAQGAERKYAYWFDLWAFGLPA